MNIAGSKHKSKLVYVTFRDLSLLKLSRPAAPRACWPGSDIKVNNNQLGLLHRNPLPVLFDRAYSSVIFISFRLSSSESGRNHRGFCPQFRETNADQRHISPKTTPRSGIMANTFASPTPCLVLARPLCPQMVSPIGASSRGRKDGRLVGSFLSTWHGDVYTRIPSRCRT
ncbi:uncharacterized protein LY79DRAFT_275056 [Colletotrichum navitas]|uniref:Uncharacterized protein n=1 Tax=Colletotrichum navitas TaxID=681940 RepID=A0AAD8PV80_9PEZI|nr:uncharacterized protein LY79DRAFT_275056 [Colletotrichum navitas]KAK1585275.1 hypothetical protein LY79DRAFT_275056 [Colletotrichum navitas]